MNEDLQEVRRALDVAAGQAAAANLLLAALIAQVPNKRQLLRDFTETTDGTKVRSSYPTMSTTFFEAFEEMASLWSAQIQNVHDDEQRRAR